MFRQAIFFLLGLFLFLLSMQIIFAFILVQGGVSGNSFFLASSPAGTIIIIGAVIIGGFYLMKIGLVSLKGVF